MDQRTLDTLAWFDQMDDNVEANPGAASAEVQLLRVLSEPDRVPGLGALAMAYRRDLVERLPPAADRNGVYVMTHAIMFGTDFGAFPLGGDTSVLRSIVLDAIEAYDEDTDVLGELLICARCLGVDAEPYRSLFDAQWTALDRGDFARNYHPILVGALLYALS